MSRGDGLLHPVPLLAIAVLVLNDHWLKQSVGSWWTGKLSDVVGMVFFPLMLQALIEVADRRPFQPRRRVLIGCALATGFVFSAINVWEPAAELYRTGLGWIQWPFRAVLAGGPVPLARVQHTLDPTDLIAAPFVLVAIAVGWSRCGEPDA